MYDDASQHSERKFQTGISGLDTILAGGLARGGLYLIEGTAGVGKTVLANQMAFAYARQGENVIYLTLLAESHGKLLHHLRHFQFYDPAHVTHRVYYISGYTELLESGLNGLLELVASLIAKYTPSLLVIDGFRSARDFFATELELAKFVHELNTFVTAASCTTVLLSPPDNTHAQPEQILVDGLIELSQVHIGLRSLRFLEVHKVRGASYLSGKHTFKVSEQGIEVYPRLESLELGGDYEAPVGEKLGFGLGLLDERLGGGLRLNSVNRVLGPSGSGKTLLALKFLEEGARLGEVGLMWSFRDSCQDLRQKTLEAGLDIESLVQDEKIILKAHTCGEFSADEAAKTMLDIIKTKGVKRLVIDSLQGFDDGLVHPERKLGFYRSLLHHLQLCGVTLLYSVALSVRDEEALEQIEYALTATHQTLLLQWDGPLVSRRRSLCVLKHTSDEANHDEFVISSQGLDLKRRERRLDSREHWLSSRQHHSFMQSSVSRVRDSALRVFRRS